MWHLRWYVERTSRDGSPSSGVNETMREPGRLWRVLRLAAAMAVAVWAITAAPAAHAVGGCGELIRDGGFETGGAWELGVSPLPPRYVSDMKHSGAKSLALGITDGGNVQSYSSARQTVTIPAGEDQAKISFWVYAMANGAPATDYMELALLTADGSAVLDKPWYSHNDGQAWNQMTFDISPWRGQTVQVYFNVYNDGLGGTAGMYLDDVSLLVCTGDAAGTLPAPAPTSVCPSSTSSACSWPTPLPTQAQCALWLPCRTPAGPSATPASATATSAAASRTPTPMPTTCSGASSASCSLAATADPAQPSGALAADPAQPSGVPAADTVQPPAAGDLPLLSVVATASAPAPSGDPATPSSGVLAAADSLATSPGSRQLQLLPITPGVTRLALPLTATAPPRVTPFQTKT